MTALFFILAILGVVTAILPVPKLPKLPDLDLIGIGDSNDKPKEEKEVPVYNTRAANGGKEYAERKLEAAARVRARWNALSPAEQEDIKKRAEVCS